MAITWRTYTDLVSTQVTAMVAAARATLDTSVGSVTLAFTQACAGVALWLQGEIARVLALTRAATSVGPDLDSWMADYNSFRLGMVPATGRLVFGRITPSTAALIPVGAQVSTGPGGLRFSVGLDTSDANYDSTQGGYVMAIGVGSITTPGTSLSAGSAGNVLANTIQSFFQSIPGVDTVNNPQPFSGGQDSETDAQFRFRFPYFLAAMQSADRDSIISAILSIQPGVRWLLVDNYDYPGDVWDPGNFFVVVDDGSGTPLPSLLLAITQAVEKERALGVRFQVYPPQLVVVSVSLVIETSPVANHALLVEHVSATISAFLNAAGLDMGILPISKLAQLAYETSSAILNVPMNQIWINGQGADLILTKVQRPIAGTVDVA